MIRDHLLICSEAQTLVGNQDVAIPSTFSIPAGRDIGTGTPIRALVTVDTTVVGGSGGVKVDYIESATANLGTPTVLASVTSAATPAAGTVLMDMAIPRNTKAYVGFQFTPLGSNITDGKIDAELIRDTQQNTPMPDGL